MINVRIKLAHPDAKVPTKNNFEDAGWDLYSIDRGEISNGYTRLIKTGIHIQIPRGFVGLIWDRSGMACKHGIHRIAGVIDSGYTGEIVVALSNLTGKRHMIECGDKVAQLIIQKIPLHVRWETVEELDASNRGSKGFGSSDK